MLLAAGVLTWMIFWMQRQARTLGADLRGRVADALQSGGAAVFWVSFVAVAREGIETALFVYAAAGKSSGPATIAGVVIGLAIATGLGVAVYHGSKRLNLGAFFRVTSILLLAFAAYLIRGGLDELAQAASSDAIETLAIVVALVYVVAMVWVYLRTTAASRRALSQ
jgi:high-affinity iron transporter